MLYTIRAKLRDSQIGSKAKWLFRIFTVKEKYTLDIFMAHP